MKSISLFVDNNSYLTKIHPYTKLLYIVAAISIPPISGILWLYPCVILVSVCLLLSARVLKKAFPLIAFSFTLIVVIFLIQGLFYYRNETVLLNLGVVSVYKEGILYATRISFNILNMLLSFAVLVLTTRPQELVEELEKSGFSPKFGYIINSVFQILPQMMMTKDTITDAQRSRGMETEGNLRTRMKAFLPLISPVVMSSLINTRERAIALEVRGFGSKNKKTYIRKREVHAGDNVINLVLIVLIVAAIAWRVKSCL